MSREKIPQTTVLEWLAENQPELHARTVIERDWLWIHGPLDGEANKPAREAIKGMLDNNGFHFAKRGHVLPDGRIAYWGHSCDKPMPFKRGPKNSKGKAGAEPQDKPIAHDYNDWEAVRREALALLA